MILYVNFWTLLTSDFHSLPSHPHRGFGRSGCWWMGCRISLIRYASWGLQTRAVCSRKKNKATETFMVESQRPSRVSVAAWSGKVMNPPSNAGSRPQHPNLIFWIWLCPFTFICFYRSFTSPKLGNLTGSFSILHWTLLFDSLYFPFFPVSELFAVSCLQPFLSQRHAG